MFRMAHMDHCCSFLMVRSRDVPMCKAMALDVEAFAVDGFKWTRSTIPKLEINWISINHFKSPAKMWRSNIYKNPKTRDLTIKKVGCHHPNLIHASSPCPGDVVNLERHRVHVCSGLNGSVGSGSTSCEYKEVGHWYYTVI